MLFKTGQNRCHSEDNFTSDSYLSLENGFGLDVWEIQARLENEKYIHIHIYVLKKKEDDEEGEEEVVGKRVIC